MDKEIWKTRFFADSCPPWPCPTCKKGVLILEDGSLKHTNTKKSMEYQDEEWWGPEHVVMSFTAWAKCTTCGEKFALSGTGGVEVVPDDQWNAEYIDVFNLEFCHPHLNLISVSENCPEKVRVALCAAFKLFFSDRPSAAGRIRVAVERLLDHLGIADKGLRGNRLTLDARIDLFSKSDAVNGPLLMAIKWLGNVGAHTDDVSEDDILDAFSVIEHVLAEVVDKKTASIAKLAADIVKKHGKPAGP